MEQYLVLRIGVGGWGAKPDGNTHFPAIQEVDWVRVWQLQDDTAVTANSDRQPNDFRLDQNYPNPFNPVTSITYAIPKPSKVKLTVYDLLGNEVRILVNEFKQPGTYTTLCKTHGLAAGLYLYALECGNQIMRRKMTLLK